MKFANIRHLCMFTTAWRLSSSWNKKVKKRFLGFHLAWRFTMVTANKEMKSFAKIGQIRDLLPYFCKLSSFLAFLVKDYGSNKRFFPYLEWPLYNHSQEILAKKQFCVDWSQIIFNLVNMVLKVAVQVKSINFQT